MLLNVLCQEFGDCVKSIHFRSMTLRWGYHEDEVGEAIQTWPREATRADRDMRGDILGYKVYMLNHEPC